jgi:hypothetical protein
MTKVAMAMAPMPSSCALLNALSANPCLLGPHRYRQNPNVLIQSDVSGSFGFCSVNNTSQRRARREVVERTISQEFFPLGSGWLC